MTEQQDCLCLKSVDDSKIFCKVLVEAFRAFFFFFFFLPVNTLNRQIISYSIPGGTVVKNPPDNSGDTRDMDWTPGSGRSPGEGLLGLPDGSDSKESAWNVGDLGLIPGLGRSLREAKATHFSILA